MIPTATRSRRTSPASAALSVSVLLAALSTVVPGIGSASAVAESARPVDPARDRQGSAAPQAQATVILDRHPFRWEKDTVLLAEPDGFVLRFAGQVQDATIHLGAGDIAPGGPVAGGDARLLLEVDVDPVRAGRPGATSGPPRDPWPRLGAVFLLSEDLGPAAAEGTAGQVPRTATEIELMRFVTGFGSQGRFVEDVTAFAPLFRGAVTFRTFISTYTEEPGWYATVRLRTVPGESGIRRPRFVRGLLTDLHVSAVRPDRRMEVVIPSGMETPRLRILSTGHASDGRGANEFVTAPHILRVNGVEVARWRPWVEGRPELRAANLWAGRRRLGGRVVWSSDLDRAGWAPGTAVSALTIPVPELTPGRHRVELVIDGIRPRDPGPDDGDHGYFAVSVTVLADERVSDE